MAQTPEGAKKALATKRKRYGDNYTKIVSKNANKAVRKRHFDDPENATKAGKKGLSKRWKS